MATSKSGPGLQSMETAAALRPGYAAPSCTSTGGATSALFAPEQYSLWLTVAQLDAGATVEWPDVHGDEGVFVARGALTVDGKRCEAGGAVIVETDVAAVARAEEPTELVHVGPTSSTPPSRGLRGPAATDGHGVHLYSGDLLDPIAIGTTSQHYFADSTCPTCRIAFFRVTTSEEFATPSHVHTKDEIIHVLTGSLQFGRQTIGAGTSVAIPGGRRYGFRASEPFSFLNYRADASTVTMAPGTKAFEESARSVRKLASRAHARASE